MDLVFTLCLPRERASVPIVRHLVQGSLERLGVDPECVADVEVAVTEACSNVLKHAEGPEDEYEVGFEISDARCEIRVTDTGAGFDHESLGGSVHPSAEGGRGIQLMRSLVDGVQFISEPQRGTVVHLVKELKLSDHSPLNRLGNKVPALY